MRKASAIGLSFLLALAFAHSGKKEKERKVKKASHQAVLEVSGFTVHGLICEGCADTVKKALRQLPGIRRAQVDVEKGRAEVEYDPAKVSAESIQQAIAEVGYPAKVKEVAQVAFVSISPWKKKTMEKTLSLPGVKKVSFPKQKVLRIVFEKEKVSLSHLLKSLQKKGFAVKLL